MNSSPPDRSRRRSDWPGYTAAAASVAAATLVRLALDPVLGDNYPFATYFGAVAVVAWGVRTRPSVAALILSGVVSLYLFLPPRHSFAPTEPGVLAGLALFLAVGGVMVAMGHNMRVAQRRADRLWAEAVVRRDELQRSEEQFRATFEQAAVGVAHVGPDGQWLRVNGTLCDILGFSRDELLCRTFQDITHPADLAADLAEVGRLVAGEITTYSMEKRYVRKGGSLVWADLTVSLVRTPDGRPDYFLSVVEDISARKASEEVSRRSEERLRLAGEAVNGLIYECDLSTRRVLVSGGSERLVGVPPGDLTTLDRWDDRIHPDDRPRVRAEADRAFAGGERNYRIGYRVTHRDGHVVHVWDHAVVDRDACGQAVRVTGHVIDVTALKRVEERLRASEQQLRLVADHVPVLIAHCDAESRYKFVNDPYARRYGLTPDEVIGKRIPDVLGERAYAAFESHVAEALAGNPVEFEAEIPDQAGGSQVMRAAYTPERDATGPVVGFVAAVVNITDRRRAEQALRDSEQRMRLATETTKVGIWEWNVVSGEVRWDASMFAIYGVPPTANGLVQYRDWTDAVLPDDLPQQEAVLHDTVRRLGTSRRAFRIRRRSDGACRHVESVEAVRPNRAGQAEWVVGTNLDVTDRVELLRRVEGERGRLADVFRQAPAFMCVLRGPDHVFEMANDRYSQLVGHRDLLGKSVREVLPEVEEQGFVRLLDGVYRTGEPFVGTGVRLLLGQPADERFVDFVYQALRDPDGVVTGVMVVGVDVTARQRAEEDVRRRAEEIQVLFDTLPVGVFVAHDPDCRTITGNAAAHALLRTPAGNLSKTATGGVVPTHFRVCRNGVEVPADQLPVQRAARGERVRDEELDDVFEDGTVLHTLVSATPLYDREGRVRGAVAGVLDITERKRQERQIEDSRRSLHAVIERCPFGIYIVDADFRIAAVNAGSQEGAFANVRPLFGRPFEEAMRVIWPAPVAADVIGRFRHTLDTGEPYRSADFVNPRADIEQTEGYEWELHRVVLPDGRHGVVCYYYDSTRLRRAEQQLREADRRKDEFLATLAHELRNPLAPIRNGLQVIKLAGANGHVEQARSMMDRQLTQMVRLVDDLLDISRVSQGKMELRRERVRVRAVIESAVETSRPLIEQSGHEFTVTVPDEPLFVDGDATRLSQVVSNLLTNSAKYTHPGGHVRLAVRRQGEAVIVSVTDNGIGIPPAMLDQVFVMFTQVDRTLEKTTGGLGIGLSLVKGLVEMHGGNIAARSEGEGRGCEFVVTLPVAPPLAAEQDLAAGQDRAVVPPERHRVLVVDDNADAADSLAQLLELLGSEVRTAYDGEAGVASAGEFRPAVVLMDIGMPKLNGYEACRRIRAEPWGKKMVLVALTGWGQDGDRLKSADAGFDHHLVKPVDYAALTTLLAGVPNVGRSLHTPVSGQGVNATYGGE